MQPFISYRKVMSVRLALFLALLLFPTSVVLAQSGGGYALEWNTIDAGGHTFSSGGAYTLGGTIGQPDAGALSGGSYTLSGGFWNAPAAPQAAIRYAAPTAQGSGDCSSWANACTLQTALTGAVSGDEIWVKMGVHYPGAAGNRNATFQLKNGVAVYGGFAGTETARKQRNPRVNQTILSGDIDQNDINTDGNFIAETPADIQGDNAYHVVNSGSTNYTAVLDGFAITAGQANGSSGSSRNGGGIVSYGGSPTLNQLVVVGNTAKYGGGMYNYNGSNPALTNVVFVNNVSDSSGGGMMNYQNCSPTLTNVAFVNNKSTNSFGGAMSNNSSSPTLTNVVFKNNDAFARAGTGIHNEYSSPTLTNVTFNGHPGHSVIYNINYSNPGLRNVIMWGDSATYKIYNVNSSNPTISYSDIQGCGGSGSWKPACGTDGGGNIEADPRFVDAAGFNLRLQLTSPAIDAGDNTAVPSGIVTDLDGNPRFVDIPTVPDTGYGTPPIVDMGAYETNYDVALGKVVLSPTVAPGQAITFTLTVANAGSFPATGIVVTDTLPAYLGDVSFASNLVVTDTGYLPPYVWLVQDLSLGQSGVITVSAVLTLPLAAGTYTNTASISAGGDLLADNNTAIVTFTVPNVAPLFTSTPVVAATQDAPYTYTATAVDNNGDALTITASVLPAWLTLEDHGDGTATLSGTPTNAEVGDHAVLLRVTDSGGLSDTQAFTVTVADVNEAPFFTSAPVLTATQDAPYAYAVVAADPDLIHGDALTITAPVLPAWLTLEDHGDGTAALSGTPTNADVGDHAVLLRVTDSGGLSDTQAFTITVGNVNEAPFFTSAPVLTATQGAPYACAVAADDPDLIHGDSLTITAPVLPAWLTLVDHGDGTATLSGTPSNADVGDHAVLLRVTDSGGLSDTQAFTITVGNVNDAPVFTSAPVLTATQGAPYTYIVAADDPDLIHGDALTITAPVLPAWLTLEDHGDGTATLSGTPSNADVGDHAVLLRVTDSGGLTDTQSFTVTVANVNDAPFFTSAPVLTATQGAPYAYAVAADDPDLIHGDSLTLTAPVLPAWLTLEDHGDGTATLSGTPSNNDVGQHLVVLRVTDSAGAFAEQEFVITVSEKPRRYIYIPLVFRNWRP